MAIPWMLVVLGVTVWAVSATGLALYVLTRKRQGPEELADPRAMPVGILLGVVAGIPLGLAFHEMAIGMAAGAAFGMTLGSVLVEAGAAPVARAAG